MEIKNIIFDFGGVLLKWDPKNLYKDIFEDKSEMEYFLENVCSQDWNLQQDAGRPLSEGTAILQNQFPEFKTLIQLFYDKWEMMIEGEISENVKLLPELKTNYRLFGLTNWSGETFPVAFKKYPFFKNFEGIVVSGDEKAIKPHEKIYRILLDRYQIKPENSLFIDDNFENIEAAQQIGFKTILFDKTTVLREELQKMNII